MSARNDFIFCCWNDQMSWSNIYWGKRREKKLKHLKKAQFVFVAVEKIKACRTYTNGIEIRVNNESEWMSNWCNIKNPVHMFKLMHVTFILLYYWICVIFHLTSMKCQYDCKCQIKTEKKTKRKKQNSTQNHTHSQIVFVFTNTHFSLRLSPQTHFKCTVNSRPFLSISCCFLSSRILFFLQTLFPSQFLWPVVVLLMYDVVSHLWRLSCIQNINQSTAWVWACGCGIIFPLTN